MIALQLKQYLAKEIIHQNDVRALRIFNIYCVGLFLAKNWVSSNTALSQLV